MGKLKKDELTEVQELTRENGNIVSSIGSLDYQKHMLCANLDENNNKLAAVKLKLQEKYGDVNINISDGTYTSIEKEDVKDQKD